LGVLEIYLLTLCNFNDENLQMKYGFDASSYKNNFSTTFQNNHVKSENLRRVGCVAGW
jgi:hypothetical protein